MRVLLVASFLLLPLAAGQGPDGGFSGSGNYCGAEFDNDGDELSYEAFCAQGDGAGGTYSGLEVLFEVGSGATFMAEGGRYSGSHDGSGEAVGFEYNLDINQVVEFVDDGDGKFDPERDEVLHIDGLASNGWRAIQASGLPDGGFEFTVDYTLQRGGTFTIQGKATGGSYSAGGIRVTPLDTKIDFLFSGYQYADDASQLALVLHVESEGGSASGGSGAFGQRSPVVQSGEGGVVGTAGTNHIYFTWAKTAMVDGQSRPVHDNVQILNDESGSFSGAGGTYSGYEAEAAITLAYARGDEIVHDPRLGVQFNVKKDSPGPAVILPLAGLLMLAAVRRRSA